MQLTETEAKAFWPLYDQYQNELFLLRSRTIMMINDYAADNEALALKAIAGEIDFQYRSIGYADYSLFKENEEDGNYTVRQWIGGSFPCVYVNQSVKDPVLRELFPHPLATLQRGYSITLNATDGTVLLDSAQARVGDTLETRLARGRVYSCITDVKP